MPGKSKRGSPYSKSKGRLDLYEVNRARLEMRILEREATGNPNRDVQLRAESAYRHWLILLYRWWQENQRKADPLVEKEIKSSVPASTILYMSRDQLSEAIKATKEHNEADTNIAAKEILNAPSNFRFPVIFSQPVDDSDDWIKCELGMPDGTKKWVVVADAEFKKLGKGKIEHPLIEIPD